MLGEKIRQLIESQSTFTKKQVAERIGMSPNNLHLLIKKDSVETKYLESLCEIFGVPISYFFDSKGLSHQKRGHDLQKNIDADVEFLQDRIRQQEKIIMELVQRVGKFESVGIAAVLLPVFFCNWLTERPTLLANIA